MTNFNEDRTFNKLKQIPLEEMKEKLSKLSKPAPAYQFHSNFNMPPVSILRNEYYPDIVLHYDRVKLLNDNGWEFEEFVFALEKIAILSIVKEFNGSIVFPLELIERAKTFFPNVKFTAASITLD